MLSRQRAHGALAVAGCLLLVGCGVSKELHRTFPLSGDGRIILDNATGGAVVRAWEYDEIRIDVAATATDGERLREAEVRFEPEPGQIRIWTDFFESESDASRPSFSFSGKGRSRVHYDLTVPRNATLERVRVLDSTLRIENVRGNVYGVSSGGSIFAVFDRIEAGRSVVLEAQGGDIHLTIPSDFDGRLQALARSGTVQSTIGIPLRTALPDGGSEGTLEETRGAGASRIRLTTNDGDIFIRTSP